MVRIGFGMRLVAALIDVAIMVCAAFVINAVILKIVGLNTTGVIIAGLVGGCAGLAYSSLEVFKAASLGKMIMKYKITMADGSPAPMDVLIKRWAIKQAPTFLQIAGVVTTVHLFGLLGLLVGLAIFVGCFLALQPEKQAYHDKLVGTAVMGPTTTTFSMPVTVPVPVGTKA